MKYKMINLLTFGLILSANSAHANNEKCIEKYIEQINAANDFWVQSRDNVGGSLLLTGTVVATPAASSMIFGPPGQFVGGTSFAFGATAASAGFVLRLPVQDTIAMGVFAELVVGSISEADSFVTGSRIIDLATLVQLSLEDTGNSIGLTSSKIRSFNTSLGNDPILPDEVLKFIKNNQNNFCEEKDGEILPLSRNKFLENLIESVIKTRQESHK